MYTQIAAVQLYSAAGTMVAWVGHTRSTHLHYLRFILVLLTYYYLRPPPRTCLTLHVMITVCVSF